MVVKLPLGDSEATFDLEKAVCSHGLFMMAPNQWDPLYKTFQRPLRLDSDDDSTSLSHIVQISQPSDTPHSLELRVFDIETLSPHHQQSLLEQVRRMLRLSEDEERKVREFREMYGESAKDKGFGRVFRSPTLFEDMVKCILLCNCQWPRTLSMARALCELQLELQCPSSRGSVVTCDAPKTPAGKESKKKNGVLVNSTNLGKRHAEVKAGREGDAAVGVDCADTSKCLQEIPKLSRRLLFSSNEMECCKQNDSCQTSSDNFEVDSASVFQSSSSIGNFPCPRELASLDERFLAKRCGLGYRATRIVNLAQSIVEGRIQLRQLEEYCGKTCLSNYSKLADQLKEINGFGPYTCSNVLMCMGFYHTIPADSETVRHLKQVHGKSSTIRDIQQDIEVIYGKYAPFQFLVYWSEVWSFYEERFGRLSELPESEYKLITATNLRNKEGSKRKRTKIS